MAKKIKITRKQMKQDDEFITVLKEILATIADYSNYIFIGLGVIVAGVLVYYGTQLYADARGKRAQAALSQAETVLMSPVVPEKDLEANPRIKKVYPNVMTSDKERLEKADEKFTDVAKRYSGTKQARIALYYEAVSKHHMGQCKEAVEAYNEYLSHAAPDDPLWPLAWTGIGYCQENDGKLDDAAAAFQKAAGYEKNSADQMTAYQSLARVDAQKKDYKGAAEAMTNYLKLAGDPQDKASAQRLLDSYKGMAGS